MDQVKCVWKKALKAVEVQTIEFLKAASHKFCLANSLVLYPTGNFIFHIVIAALHV